MIEVEAPAVRRAGLRVTLATWGRAASSVLAEAVEAVLGRVEAPKPPGLTRCACAPLQAVRASAAIRIRGICAYRGRGLPK